MSLLLAFTLLAAERVTIVEGKSTIADLPFPPASGVNANPAVLQAVPDVKAKRIVFFGKKAGVATYVVYDAKRKSSREYDVEVIKVDLGKTKADLQVQLEDLEDVVVSIAGDRVLVEGEVVTEGELDRVRRLTRGRPEVTDLVRLSAVALKAIAKTIEKEIHAAGLEGVTARAGGEVDESLALVAVELERMRSERLADSFGMEPESRPPLDAALAPFAKKRARAVRDHLQGKDGAKKAYAAAADGEWEALAKALPKVTGGKKASHAELRADFDATILDNLSR